MFGKFPNDQFEKLKNFKQPFLKFVVLEKNHFLFKTEKKYFYRFSFETKNNIL